MVEKKGLKVNLHSTPVQLKDIDIAVLFTKPSSDEREIFDDRGKNFLKVSERRQRIYSSSVVGSCDCDTSEPPEWNFRLINVDREDLMRRTCGWDLKTRFKGLKTGGG